MEMSLVLPWPLRVFYVPTGAREFEQAIYFTNPKPRHLTFS